MGGLLFYLIPRFTLKFPRLFAEGFLLRIFGFPILNLNKNNFMARYQMALSALQLGDASLAVVQLEEIMAVKANLPLKQKANEQLKKIMKN